MYTSNNYDVLARGVRAHLNVPAVRFTPERISKRTGVVLAVPGAGCRLGAAPVHVVVYEKVRRAIKFTGSVLHRAARVVLCVCTSDPREGGSEGGSTNSVSGGQWLLW